MSNTIGTIIKKLRKDRGLSQNDVAEKLYMTPQNISRVENGEGEPTVEMLLHLADLFEVSVDTLVGRQEISEGELFKNISHYLKSANGDTTGKRIFAIEKNILHGRMASVFGEDAFAKDVAKTYSTISANGFVGIYADREDCPCTFAAMDTRDFNLTQQEMEGLSNLFAALSSNTLYSLLCRIYPVMQEQKLYDRASFCETFAICDCDFENLVDSMQKCKCISVQKVFLNKKETTLDQPYISREALFLIQFAKLLYLRSTDGNV